MDAAIEYQAKLLEIKRIINTLNSVGIKGERYLKKVNVVEETVKKDIEEKNNNKGILNKNSAVGIYTKAIANLEVIKNELQKYNSYIEGYYYCNYLEDKLTSDKVTPEEVTDYSKRVIQLMNMINNSDTRDYEEEQVIVEKIYSLAYQVMKLEFEILGKSEIFDIVKENPVMESFINLEIEKDINLLSEEKRNNKLIKGSLNKVMSSGINYSYMDKVLITALALNDDNSAIKKVEDNLRELYNTIVNNSKEIEAIKHDVDRELEDSSDKLQRIKIYSRSNKIELFKRISAGVVSLGILFGIWRGARALVTSKKYFTTKESYSSTSGYSKEESYQEKVDNFNSLYLYEYEPYEVYSRDYYKRHYTMYDISNINVDSNNLEDYLNVNLKLANSSDSYYGDGKYKEEMSPEDFYDEVLYEVVKIVQNPDDVIVKKDTFLEVGLTILVGLLAELGYLRLLVEWDPFYELESNVNRKKNLQKGLLKLKNDIETYRRLIDNNKEVKERFTKAYETYRPLLESSEFKDKLNGMIDVVEIEDPQIELDKRKAKMLQKVKDKN